MCDIMIEEMLIQTELCGIHMKFLKIYSSMHKRFEGLLKNKHYTLVNLVREDAIYKKCCTKSPLN